MSGGTWDYRQNDIRFLADEIRAGEARWHEDGDKLLDLPNARKAIADLLDVTARLTTELDHHFAGDSFIDDEQTWMRGMRLLVRGCLIQRA